MNDASKTVFPIYASQDAEALRASGVEVWFDKDELTGDAAWDAKIRVQIASCALLGRPDDAMRLLREAFARYSVTMKDFSWPGVLVSPDFDALRTHPSFQEFITPKG